jgi:peptidyl-prolyl cis-trans isomerase C
MRVSGKVVAAIAVVSLLAVLLILAQWSSSAPTEYKLTAHDIEVLVSEVMPPGQLEEFASKPEERQKLAKQLKEILALAQAAEMESLADRPDIKGQVALQEDVAIRSSYTKVNPDAKVTDEDINAFYQANPNALESFLDANPNIKAQAQGAQADQIRKAFGELKVFVERARKEGIDKSEGTRLRVLIERSSILAQAYRNNLRDLSSKQISDADVEQYYNQHPEEFEEVRARHILVSTQPDDESTDPAGKDSKPKAISKDEAGRKAQMLLDRVRKGEDFAKLAEEHSDDKGSKEKGGDLGYFGRGTMVEEFQNAAFALKPGQVSDLVESPFGFHIIKLEDHRQKSLADPASKQQITEKVKQEKLKKQIEDIVARSGVEVAEDFNINPTIQQ